MLGATGSIGCSTLDVIGRHPDRFSVYALSANNRVDALVEQCRVYQPAYAVIADEDYADNLSDKLAAASPNTTLLTGPSGLEQIASDPNVDVVMAAIVGAAGLDSTMAAVHAGKTVLLANKEALVMAGALFMQAVEISGATVLPIDSEHNAIFQCLPEVVQNGGKIGSHGIRKIILTASGGPFRDWSLADMRSVTPEQACAHPNWSMGRKISVDSATLMNKGLELIEACRLFTVGPEQIEIVIHPQSVVHSMVDYDDGSVLAQMGNPDMRTPIAYGLAWPQRIDSGVTALDLVTTGALEFEAPDIQRFPSLRLARSAAEAGGGASAVLNAANEEAVASFLRGDIPFTGIAELVESVLEAAPAAEPLTLNDVKEVDGLARDLAREFMIQKNCRWG